MTFPKDPYVNMFGSPFGGAACPPPPTEVAALREQINVLDKRLSEETTGRFNHDRNLGTHIAELREGLLKLQTEVTAAIKRSEESAGGFWRMGTGRLIRVRDMTDSHIVNTIAWLEERKSYRATDAAFRTQWIARLKSEQDRRAEEKQWEAKTQISPEARDFIERSRNGSTDTVGVGEVTVTFTRDELEKLTGLVGITRDAKLPTGLYRKLGKALGGYFQLPFGVSYEKGCLDVVEWQRQFRRYFLDREAARINPGD